MKAVCFENSFISKDSPNEPYFYLKPETAFLHNNRPFYIPDYTNDIRIQPFIAVKISKIGKYISEKFAFGYFNEFTVGICFTANDLFNKLKANNASNDIARNFDFCCPIGKFITKPAEEEFNKTKVSLVINSGPEFSFSINDMILNFNKMISESSGFVSLKIGDIVMATYGMSSDPVIVNDKLQVRVNDQPIVNVEIK